VGRLDDEACLRSNRLNRGSRQPAIEHHAEYQFQGA
ncbi:uncharacterized protein METZ01_LOCUS121119, partial [marine metagenome]